MSMRDTQAKINKSVKGIAEANQRKDAFHAHIDSASKQSMVPGTVHIEGETVVVECLGHVVTAMPRLVRDSDDLFRTEYDFQADFQYGKVSVWRVHLTPDGCLFSLPSFDPRIGAFDNAHIHQLILTYVSEGLLESAIFAPTDEVATAL